MSAYKESFVNWLRIMGIQEKDMPSDSEMCWYMAPEYQRYFMHIIRNTRPSNEAVKIQGNVVREHLRSDLPASNFPLKIELNSVADLICYKEVLKILELAEPYKRDAERNLNYAYYLQKIIDEKKAVRNNKSNYKQFELFKFYGNQIFRAENLESIFKHQLQQYQLLEQKYNNILTVKTEVMSFNVMSNLWQDVIFKDMLNTIVVVKSNYKKIVEIDSDRSMSDPVISEDDMAKLTGELINDTISQEITDLQFNPLLKQFNDLFQQICPSEEPLSFPTSNCLPEILTELIFCPVNDNNAIILLQEIPNGDIVSVNLFFDNFNLISKKNSELKNAQTELDELLKKISSLLMELPIRQNISVSEESKLKVADPMTEILIRYLNNELKNSSWEASICLTDRTLEMHDFSFNAEELKKILMNAKEKILNAQADLISLNEEKYKYLCDCIEQCKHRMVFGTSLASCMRKRYFGLSDSD